MHTKQMIILEKSEFASFMVGFRLDARFVYGILVGKSEYRVSNIKDTCLTITKLDIITYLQVASSQIIYQILTNKLRECISY